MVRITIAALLALSGLASAETVYVKYRGPVSLDGFSCQSFTRSSVVDRICYRAKQQYALVSLNGTYYHYCQIPQDVVAAWQQADSLGRFYGAYVKGRYDCRMYGPPQL